jgi:hypothetical protein
MPSLHITITLRRRDTKLKPLRNGFNAHECAVKETGVRFILVARSYTDEHAKKPGSLPNSSHSPLLVNAISKYQACGQGTMR